MTTNNVLPDETDVVVIGLGPAGEEAAARLVDGGLRVVGIERELVGGECPYWGCVPSKMVIRAAETLAEARRVPLLAGAVDVRPDYAPVARRIREEATADWDDTLAVERLEKAGVVVVHGAATVEAPGRLRVGDAAVTARRGVVVATGSAPVHPPIPGLAAAGYWTNREAIAARGVPDSLVVLGGGAIGLELAQAFARFGCAVTVVEGARRVLPMEEPEASTVVAEALRGDGVAVCTGRRAVAVERRGERTHVTLDDGTEVAGAELLVAVGRRPAGAGLGLEHYGVEGPAVPVDGRMRAADGLWAAGDVTGIAAFTHLAVHHARIAAADILGRDVEPADHTALPRVTFTDPEVGSVGVTEEAARAAGIDVATVVVPTAESSRGFIHGPGNAGLVKLVVDADTDRLVGATSAGPRGGEVLGLLTLAVHARIQVSTLRSMIYAYPTFHRGVLDALTRLGAS